MTRISAPRMPARLFSGAVLIVAVVLFTGSPRVAHAFLYTWQGAGITSTATDSANAATQWTNAANWNSASPGTIPTAQIDIAVLDLTTDGSVYITNYDDFISRIAFSTRTANANLVLRGGTADLTLRQLRIGSVNQPLGKFTHESGDLTIAEFIAVDAPNRATYTMAGGRLMLGDQEQFRVSRGDVLQSGGTITGFGRLHLGYEAGTASTFVISGGTFSLNEIRTDAGTGTFTQSGGVVMVDSLRLGALDVLSGSPQMTWNILGGSLEVERLDVGGYGGSATMNLFAPAAQVRATDYVRFANNATLTASGGTTLAVAGELRIESTSPQRLSDLAQVRVFVEGGGPSTRRFVELAGRDLGPIAAGWQDNFSIGTLELGGPFDTVLTLNDGVNNNPAFQGAAALYVEHLIVPADAVLELNGYNLYAHTADIHPSARIEFGGGSLYVTKSRMGRCGFSEATVGSGNYTPGAGAQELGFLRGYPETNLALTCLVCVLCVRFCFLDTGACTWTCQHANRIRAT